VFRRSSIGQTDFMPEHQCLNSLQYLDFVNNNYNLQGFHQGISGISSENAFVTNTIANSNVNVNVSPSALDYLHNRNLNSTSLSPFKAFQTMQARTFSPARPPFYNTDLSTAAIASGVFEPKALDEFDPFITDASQNPSRSTDSNDNDSERCPDLCASTSSLLEDGDFIIQSSESFKENNYAKAQIVSADTSILNLVGLSSDENSKEVPDNNDRNGSICVSENESVTDSAANKPITLHDESSSSASRFKPFHEEKWHFHYQELLNFKKENGHCLVPHTYPAKPHLARWVKRQRRQYKLKLEGNKNSTMTEERINILNEIGFVWDSHEVIWNERFSQLVAYKQKFGHCRVPSYCKECPQLASWVKCQRRQYKLFWEQGKGSSMNLDRIKLLNSIGFIWEVHPGRKRKENEQHFQHLANLLMDS